MADISKIKTPDGTEYNIKDTTARGLVVANPTLAGTESDLTGLQVNGTKYKVPSGGGSSISPYASNPAMDGAASPGSSNDYARGDHVHPTDTTRQAKITASGVLIGNGSGGITAKTLDTSSLTNDNNHVPTSGVVKSALNNAKALSFTVTLTVDGWWGVYSQIISNANFVASGYAYTVAPASSSFADYASAQVYADDVTVDGLMTFHCASTPSSNLTVNVLRVEVSA